jgi:chromosomal replication initiation ATPase DnaA
MPAIAIAQTGRHSAKSHSFASRRVLSQEAQVQLVLSYMHCSQNVAPEYMLGPSRGSRYLSSARQDLYYLLHIAFGMSFTHISSKVARDRTSVSYGVRQVEERRDNADIDRALHFAELALMHCFETSWGVTNDPRR